MRRRFWLEDVVLDVLAVLWLGRGFWRASRGRAPWKGSA
jgi:hypothetical protein